MFLAWVRCFWLWFFEWVCSGGFQIGGVILIGGLGGGCGGRCWLWFDGLCVWLCVALLMGLCVALLMGLCVCGSVR